MTNEASPTTEDSNSRKKFDITYDDEGRLVTITLKMDDTRDFVFRHRFPDALTHHYKTGQNSEPVHLYKGEFQFTENQGSDQNFTGGIFLRWTPTPQVIAYGERYDTDHEDLMAAMLNPSMWSPMPQVKIPELSHTIPDQPDKLPETLNTKSNGNYFTSTRVRSSEVGLSDDVERITFIVPNGWNGMDGFQICDPVDPSRYWHGRCIADSGGWTIRIDQLEAARGNFWDKLKERGGVQVSHIGEVRRSDGTTFKAREADEALEILRIAISIAVGRSTCGMLPVGWQEGSPIWTTWKSGPVDPYKTVPTWLDQSVANQQVCNLIEKMLDLCLGDEEKTRVIRYAQSYYVTANYDVDAELSVAVPVSGLQLLAFHRFVEDRKQYSISRWEDSASYPHKTEDEIRLLLEDCNIDMSIPQHFKHLQNVSTVIAENSGQAAPDALGCIIKMRNSVIHPTKKRPSKWSPYEWVEAGVISRHFLQLAILNTVSYDFKIGLTTTPGRRTGDVSDPPWISTSDKSSSVDSSLDE